MRRLFVVVIFFAALPLTGVAAAEEPWISSSWNFGGGSYRDAAFTVSATATGLKVSAGESLPWGGAYGCTITAGTVGYDLTLVGKDSSGNKLYSGKGLGWTSSGGVCSTTGLADGFSAVLKPGSNGFSTPSLAYGVDNVIAVYSGTYKSGDTMPVGAKDVFYRKGGTTAGSSASSGTTTTTTVGTSAGDTDDERPDVAALTSTGKRGTAVGLRFTSSDDSGEAYEQFTVYKGNKVLGRVSTTLGERDPDEIYTITWTAKKTIYGKLRFCVVGVDETGNKSKPSCAVLTLSK